MKDNKHTPTPRLKDASDHANALKEIERLWNAEPGTADEARLEILCCLVEAYEHEHYPIDPPDLNKASSLQAKAKGAV